jgi:hypothetical protein
MDNFMTKEPDMTHIDEFLAELDEAELAYLQDACKAKAPVEEEEEAMPKKPKIPAGEIPFEEEED